MEIIATSAAGDVSNGKILIRHGDGEVAFNFSTFKRENIEKNDVFTHLNKFWADQPLSFQQAVFDHYVKIGDYFFQINDKDFLTKMLQKALAEMYSMYNFEKTRDWLVYKSGITFPEISEEYTQDTDRDYTPEKTYIRKEYIDMVTFAFLIRMSIPIWSYYVRIIKDKAGTGLKEHRAWELLKNTFFYSHPVVKKMEGYIRANSKKAVIRSGALGLLNPEDQPYWRMSTFVVRKLATAELQFKAPNATLVTLLWTFARVSNTEGDFQTRYKDKTPAKDAAGGEGSGNDDRASSTYERHRNNTNISIEEAAEYRTALNGVHDTASKLCPLLPPALLERTIASSSSLLEIENIVLTALPCQKTLLGWIMSPVLSTEGIPYQDPETIVRHMALAEALLWHKGFHYLSLLVTCRTPLDNSIHHVSSSPVRSRLSEENALKLRELYPHVKVIQNRKSDPREECMVTNAIDDLSSDIAEYTWLITAHESHVQAFQRSSSRRLTTIPDIRNELARLIIAINTKSLYQ